jgi:phosphoribosylamine--glycine ligase
MTRSRRRLLLVGSWAKEEITVEHLQATSEAEVYAFLDVPNPGILERADGCRVGRTGDVDAVADYAEELGCELVLVTTAAPLAAGLADRLEERDLRAFAPHREAARLEWDKAFARRRVAESSPEALPRFEVFDEAGEATAFAADLGWQVAVKPLGLTEGLGVRVAGDQLSGAEAVRDYIGEVLREGIGGRSQVLVEERLQGVEFALQALVDGERLAAFPAVADFKKLLPGDRGPNTASMGSWAAAGPLLPFMTREHYDEGVAVLRRTLEAMAAAGTPCRGFLYGQFMITAAGLKLIEYNFRPGDPEWINTLAVLETPLLSAIDALAAGEEPELVCRAQASVVEYLVPEGYPEKLHQQLDLRFDRRRLADRGVRVYFSAGRGDSGRLEVGTERGIALLATAATIEQAHAELEEAVAGIDGEFFHRGDIGCAAQVRSKVERTARLALPRQCLRPASEDDFLAVCDLAAGCPPLEAYPAHQVKILLRYHGDVCFVAETDGEIDAFEMGFGSSRRPGTYFLWQIGVAPGRQGTGLGRRLLTHVEREVARRGWRRIEVTVDPENHPSRKLFEAMGYRNISRREGETVEVAGQIAVRDYYSPGRHFLLFEKELTVAPPSESKSPEPRHAVPVGSE